MKTIKTPAIIEGLRSRKDGSLGLTVSTPELRPEEKTLFFELQGVNLDIKITPSDDAKAEEIEINADLEQKTPSQRLRASLYRLLEAQLGRKPEHSQWEEFYRTSMEKIISDVQNQIDG